MDFGTLIVLGLLWLVFNLLRQGGSKPQPPRPPPPPPPPPTPARSGVDATQREGGRLEVLLRELHRSMEDAARLATVEEVEEERETLEVAPEVVTLERKVDERPARPARPARPRVDQDDLAEQVAARRIAAAQARSGALTPADHRTFDQRIRQEPADHTAAARTYAPQRLRDAIVWREILGRPVADREGGR